MLHRKDVHQDCGGLFAQVRSDIPHTRGNDMEEYIVSTGRIECMVIELILKSEKWLLCSVYKQPKVPIQILTK